MNEMNKQVATTRRLSGPIAIALLLGAALGGLGVYFGHARIAKWLGRQPEATAAAAGEPARELWTCGMHPQVIQDHPGDCPICHMKLTPLVQRANGNQASAERRILYWWDPMMNPPYISKQPGQSPMGMELVPVYADDQNTSGTVTIDPTIVQNMGLRTALVIEGPLNTTVRAVGYLVEAEPNIVDVNLRLSGWIEAQTADTVGVLLHKGDTLFDLYSPELELAVGELIAARKSMAGDGAAGGGAAELYAASLRKLELLGIAPEQVEELAALDQAPRTVAFSSPIDGHLMEKDVVVGSAVHAGDRIMRIVDHSTLWLNAWVYEQDQPLVRVGQTMSARIASLPGVVFHGDVVFIHPHVDERTRAEMVRISIANPDLRLRPGMFASAELDAEIAARAVLVPREAVIDSGLKRLAFVDLGDGHFEPRDVELGLSGRGGLVQVHSGLAPGERVVTSGQFLIDTESRLSEAVQKFLRAAQEPEKSPAESEPVVLPAGPRLDRVFEAYLALARALGAPQQGSAPADIAPLDAAARALRDDLQDESQRRIAGALVLHVLALAGQPIERQRQLFRDLSEALIAIARRSKPSTAVAEHIYVMRCPMAPGTWIQDQPEIANPYYATEMKSCGDLLETLDLGSEEKQ